MAGLGGMRSPAILPGVVPMQVTQPAARAAASKSLVSIADHRGGVIAAAGWRFPCASSEDHFSPTWCRGPAGGQHHGLPLGCPRDRQRRVCGCQLLLLCALHKREAPGRWL